MIDRGTESIRCIDREPVDRVDSRGRTTAASKVRAVDDDAMRVLDLRGPRDHEGCRLGQLLYKGQDVEQRGINLSDFDGEVERSGKCIEFEALTKTSTMCL